MSLSISQIAASSYPAILNKKKPANQWVQNSFLRELERQGAIKHMDFGPTIEAPLDYQRNPGTEILTTDLQATSLQLTTVITSASFTPASVSVPVVWSKAEEAQNSSMVQKIALVASKFGNAIDSHDDILEQSLFLTNTNGFLGLVTHIPSTGLSVDGGIDSNIYTFWRPQNAMFNDDTDIESGMTTIYNSCAKGSASELEPKIIVSDGPTQALFEGTQQANQRWVDTDELKAGFKTLAFKNARYVYSQYGTGNLYFLNPKNFNLAVSKTYFRDKGDTQEIPNANGFVCKIYSACQTVTDNRSRLGVLVSNNPV